MRHIKGTCGKAVVFKWKTLQPGAGCRSTPFAALLTKLRQRKDLRSVRGYPLSLHKKARLIDNRSRDVVQSHRSHLRWSTSRPGRSTKHIRVLFDLERRLHRNYKQSSKPFELDRRHWHILPGWTSQLGNRRNPNLHQSPPKSQAHGRWRSADHPTPRRKWSVDVCTYRVTAYRLYG